MSLLFFAALGGRKATSGGDYTEDVNGYRYHIFSTTGSHTMTWGYSPGVSTVEVLVIGGGGSGGFAYAGGGGAGGVHLWSSVSVAGLSSSAITVGVGGTISNRQILTLPVPGGSSGYAGVSGGFSRFVGTTTLTGGGGGAGASGDGNGSGGGSGGGAAGESSSGSNTGGAANGQGTGNAGGNGGQSGGQWGAGGGGGYTSAGSNASGQTAGAGGQGLLVSDLGDIESHSIFSGMTRVASGGGGGSWGSGVGGSAASGGTGAGSGSTSGLGDNATSFGSGGGGGAGYTSGSPYGCSGGNGYQGLVIVRYQL